MGGVGVDRDDVLGRDDVEHLDARSNLREAQEVQRGIRIELARLSERGVGHHHRPHLGELNEQDVARPTVGRGGESHESLDAERHREEPRKRDPDPEVDGPHEIRIQGRFAPFCPRRRDLSNSHSHVRLILAVLVTTDATSILSLT